MSVAMSGLKNFRMAGEGSVFIGKDDDFALVEVNTKSMVKAQTKGWWPGKNLAKAVKTHVVAPLKKAIVEKVVPWVAEKLSEFDQWVKDLAEKWKKMCLWKEREYHLGQASIAFGEDGGSMSVAFKAKLSYSDGGIKDLLNWALHGKATKYGTAPSMLDTVTNDIYKDAPFMNKLTYATCASLIILDMKMDEFDMTNLDLRLPTITVTMGCDILQKNLENSDLGRIFEAVAGLVGGTCDIVQRVGAKIAPTENFETSRLSIFLQNNLGPTVAVAVNEGTKAVLDRVVPTLSEKMPTWDQAKGRHAIEKCIPILNRHNDCLKNKALPCKVDALKWLRNKTERSDAEQEAAAEKIKIMAKQVYNVAKNKFDSQFEAGKDLVAIHADELISYAKNMAECAKLPFATLDTQS